MSKYVSQNVRHMKQASIRRLQHHLSEVMQWVDQGEEVRITNRNRPVAKLIPLRTKTKILTWPDFSKRAKQAVQEPKGTLSGILYEQRGE